MGKFSNIITNLKTSNTDMVVRGHNKKFLVTLNPHDFSYDKKGDAYYFKYDAEKERLGNMQKRLASSFCSYLTDKYGGNFVLDIPGLVIIEGGQKEDYTITLKGVFSKSYREDYHIYHTFTLDNVLKPRPDEEFEYNNKHRVFASVENSMERLKSYIQLQQNKAMVNPEKAPFSPYLSLNHLEEDFKKIEQDLVSVVMLDYLFLNNDRHTENIEFSIMFDENHEYHLVLSPIFDNDRTFGLDKTEKDILRDCENHRRREIYVNYTADMKYMIREKDCSDEFASEMNFSHNYHSDVIVEYIRRQCLTNGVLDKEKLENNSIYRLYENYKNIDIRQEFYDFMSEVAGISKVNSKLMDMEDEQEFIDRFNYLTKSTLNSNHVRELTENFNIRQSNLNRSKEARIPTNELIK
jgi:hypothetical protein